MAATAIATTHLFYGLFVTVPSLIIAADAFHFMTGPTKVINLIILRQRNNKRTTELSTESKPISTACMKIPSEIWTKIKEELRLIILDRCRTMFNTRIEDDPYDEESTEDGACGSCRKIHRSKSLNKWGRPSCDSRAIVINYNLQKALDNNTLIKIKRLLASYGLQLVTTTPFRPPHTYLSDITSFLPITFISKRLDQLRIKVSDENPFDADAFYGIQTRSREEMEDYLNSNSSTETINMETLSMTAVDKFEYFKRFNLFRLNFRVKARKSAKATLAERIKSLNLAESNIDDEDKDSVAGRSPRWIMHATIESENQEEDDDDDCW